MSDVDGRALQVVVQLADLGAHLHAQLGVQVAERLIEQEALRVPHDGAPQGNALPLPAGQRLGLALEQRNDGQNVRRPAHLLLDLGLGHLA
jgi:hypothetical protein